MNEFVVAGRPPKKSEETQKVSADLSTIVGQTVDIGRGVSGSGTQRVAIAADVLTVLYDDAGSSITYIGKAPVGTLTSAASWQIAKLDESSTPDFTMKYAGTGIFNQVWDSRAGLSYS